MADLSFSRRALLGNVPAVAALVASPAVASALFTPVPFVHSDAEVSRQLLKANLVTAEKAYDYARECYANADEELCKVNQTAPTAEIEYTFAGFKTGSVSVAPYETSFKVDRSNYKSGRIPDEVKASPQYQAYCQDLASWKKSPGRVASKTAEQTASEADAQAWQAFKREWHELVNYPLADTRLILDKITVARPFAVEDEEWLGTLVDAVAADLSRVNGGAA